MYSWEYNISGIIGCIVAVYIVHVPRISRWIGLLVCEFLFSKVEREAKGRLNSGRVSSRTSCCCRKEIDQVW